MRFQSTLCFSNHEHSLIADATPSVTVPRNVLNDAAFAGVAFPGATMSSAVTAAWREVAIQHSRHIDRTPSGEEPRPSSSRALSDAMPRRLG